MKALLAPALLCLTLLPAAAQDAVPQADPDMERGFSLMDEGARLLFRGLMSQMEPALDDMGRALTEMEPAFRDLITMMGDIRNYKPPEMLPNGDIIIRRKTPAERAAEDPADEIEL